MSRESTYVKVRNKRGGVHNGKPVAEHLKKKNALLNHIAVVEPLAIRTIATKESVPTIETWKSSREFTALFQHMPI